MFPLGTQGFPLFVEFTELAGDFGDFGFILVEYESLALDF